MEGLLEKQAAVMEDIKRMSRNIKKDPRERKTLEYRQARASRIDELWRTFEENHQLLMQEEDKTHQYYTENIYDFVMQIKDEIVQLLKPKPLTPPPPPPVEKKVTFDIFMEASGEGTDTLQIKDKKVLELMRTQRSNFRSLIRLIDSLHLDNLVEKWEIEDEIKSLKGRWNTIDILHLQIDSILEGRDDTYNNQYLLHEKSFKDMKKQLNMKLNFVDHSQQTAPKVDIPIFSGNYSQWPTFMDLFSESIHKNPNMSKSHKMQILKCKLKGEAERIVQHLHISAENYDACWDLLTHRYNNLQLLFTKQIQLFLRQPNVKTQSAFEIKKLFDTSMEVIHAINNLGVDTMNWDPILVHILCEKLDTQTYTDYMEYRKSPRQLAKLQEFMDFLEGKFTALEPVTKKKPDNMTLHKPFNDNQQNYHREYRTNFSKPSYNNAMHIQEHKSSCSFCRQDHDLFKCTKFLSMSPDVQLKHMAQFNICKNCLYYHSKNYCKSEKRCRECNAAHNTLLHKAFSMKPTTSTATKMSPTSTPFTPGNHQKRNVHYAIGSDDEIMLATALLKVKATDGTYMTLRAFIDPGSQVTLITESAAQKLGLQRTQYNACIAGVGSVTNKSRGKVNLTCMSRHNDFTFETDALVMSRVVSNLPNVTFEKKNWSHIEHLTLADPDYNISRSIDILLDASVHSQIIMGGLLTGTDLQPCAQQTKLGWILSGGSGTGRTYNCHVITNNTDDIKKYWEMEEITEAKNMTSQEQYCEDLYVSTTRRLQNGQYEVQLPMVADYKEKLGESKGKALAQFHRLEKKLSNDTELSDSYKKFMQEYIDLEHMKKSTSQSDIECFLPHHGVVKPDSTTTKLRVVFNASSKTSSGLSLNDLMECGPKLHQDLQAVLIRWRTYEHVFSADCEKMYRMILVAENMQPLQKILWRNDIHEPIQEYDLCTLTFGEKAAPYLALRTLKQLAQDEAHKYPLAAQVIEREVYVDDVMSGAHCIATALEKQQQLINMLKSAGFNLRKWSSNHPALLEHLPEDQKNKPIVFKDKETTKALGLQWIPQSDKFTFKNKNNDTNDKPLTKRMLLSQISKLFDPLGWLTPITIKAKLLFQTVWTTVEGWDDIIPESLTKDWRKLQADMCLIEAFDIPRWVGNLTKSFEIHGFCDASQKVFAAGIWIKTLTDNGDTIVRLLVAKSKLAPLNKTITLPRLELCATVLLAQLMTKALENIDYHSHNITVHAWTDSMIVLGWLQGDPKKWKSFVANRVKQVTSAIPASSWRYVKSEENAVDCATRGLTPAQLQHHSLWWEGPQWIKNPELQLQTPIVTSAVDNNIQMEAKNKQVNSAKLQPSDIVLELLYRHSKLSHVTRIVAWILRSKISRTNKPAYLTSAELTNALHTIIRNVQLHEFGDDITRLKTKQNVSRRSPLLSLNPFLDENGILRLGGRLTKSALPDDMKKPIILSSKSRLTELIIKQAHEVLLHGGPRLTLTYLRRKYWILSGHRTVKSQLHRCVTCRRYSPQQNNQLMADLPKPRVTISRPFTHTGVDYTGHVEVKANKGRGIRTLKGYIAVFVCLATKAIHLEMVTDLDTPSFLAAFKRFCARRGKPEACYSDQGTNFIGADRILKQQYQDCLKCIDTTFLKDVSEMGVTWHFNAPAWPTAGGLWEAAVKSMKYHLYRVIGNQKLTYEEFTTLLCQIEACLNSRPLYTLTEADTELDILTPGHFLIGGPIHSVAEPETEQIDIRKRWQLVRKMSNDFWKTWSNEYLTQLQSRSKWKTSQKDLQINDIVCIKEENLPAGRWGMGRVVETFPGTDKRVRVVLLKTARGYLKRPITKLAKLLTNDTDTDTEEEDDTTQQNKQQRTRCTKKKITVASLLCYAFMFFMMIITPTLQENVTYFQITELQPSKMLYFDKISELLLIRDDWKLVTYYNMSTYWQGINDIENYVMHIKNFARKQEYDTHSELIIRQLDHDMNELMYYNSILQSHHITRRKRGLINAVGSVTNVLFGVLDQGFADKYEEDIGKIRQNDEHLLQLIKNQTTIFEAQQNIIKRNEAIMNTQFKLIYKQIEDIKLRMNESKVFYEHLYYVLTASTTADRIIANLKAIQQFLINTLTNMYQGHVDVHLLPPEQLKEHLSFVSKHVPTDLTLPDVRDNFIYIYKLLRGQVRLTRNYLIMEIKIPLMAHDKYELDRVVTLPHYQGKSVLNTYAATEYVAFNVMKGLIIPLNPEDISSCLIPNDQQMFCKVNHPQYNMQVSNSICNINLKTNKGVTYCNTERTADCSDKWVKLHDDDTWLYACCKECLVRIICPGAMTSKRLLGNGLIKLHQGCVVKGDDFTIYAHDELNSRLIVQNSVIEVPKMSPLNEVINTSIPTQDFQMEVHDKQFDKINEDIQTLKEQSAIVTVSSHDLHHYIMIYGVLTFGVVAVIVISCYMCKIKGQIKQNNRDIEMSAVRPNAISVNVDQCRAMSQSVLSVDQATSPMMKRLVKFDKT